MSICWNSVNPIHKESEKLPSLDCVLAYSCLSKLGQKIWLMEYVGFGVWIWERELWERDLGVGLLFAPCFLWRTTQDMVWYCYSLNSQLCFLLPFIAQTSFYVAGMPILVGFAYGLSFIFFAFQHHQMRYWSLNISWKIVKGSFNNHVALSFHLDLHIYHYTKDWFCIKTRFLSWNNWI